ncbi:MAG TPA: glycerate kinase [Candidatus Spyradocola merdavium]|nr:glycerate kinase [Candidatus Spyradocola merdavium]
MKVVVAMDSFKGSLTSLAAGAAVREGILRADPAAEVLVRPLADGGEGTVEALVSGMGGRLRTVRVTGPLGEGVDCAYGVLGDTAVIEMAGAAGLPLVPAEERDPLRTTTYGVGEVIADAIAQGCRRFLVGIGGSATNDGGAGMLQALGFGLLDAEGRDIPRGAQGLKKLARIETAGALPALVGCRFRVACDVTNPLCGEKGASAVFGPQKGARPADIPRMDAWLAAYAQIAAKAFPGADPEAPGTGAAGGLGFAFRTFLSGELEPGVQIVLEETRLAEALAGADVVVTGEGRLDGQTAMGKAPVGVARLAKARGCLVLALAGGVTRDAGACNGVGIDAFFPAVRGVTTLAEAMDPENARANLADAAEQAFRLLAAARA